MRGKGRDRWKGLDKNEEDREETMPVVGGKEADRGYEGRRKEEKGGVRV